jgi:hypothetical protein
MTMGRWLRRIAMLLVLLIVVALVAVQVILGGDLPRRKIVEALEAQTGLVVDIASSRIGWTGDTVVNRLSLRMDETSEPIARITRAHVKHNSLWNVLLSRQVRIETVVLNGATLRTTEDEQGIWDIERATERVIERQQGQSPSAQAPPIITAEGLRLEVSGQAVSLDGEIDVRVADGKARLEIKTWNLTSPDAAFEPVTVRGGVVRGSATRVAMEGVRIDLGTNTARLDGQWTLPGGGGDDAHQLIATIVASGSVRDVVWDGTLQMSAMGLTPKQMDAQLSLTRGMVSRGDAMMLDLEGLAAVIKVQCPVVRLESLALADRDALKASGRINAHTRQWAANVRLNQWPTAVAPLDLAVAAKGRGTAATVESFTATIDAMTVKGTGTFDPSRDKPVDAEIALAWRPNALPQGAAGAFDYRAKLRGTVEPLDLHAAGTLAATALRYDGTSLDDLTVPLALHVDDTHTTWQSEPFAMLGGHGVILGRHRFSDSDTQLTAELKHVSLAAVAPLLDDDLILAGAMDATVDLTPRQLSGEWTISGLRAGPLETEHMAGRFIVEDRVVTIEPLTMNHQSGSANGRMVIDMDDTRATAVSMELERWPVSLRDGLATLTVSGECAGHINLVDRTAEGTMSLRTSVATPRGDLNAIEIEGTLAGDRLVLDRVAGDVFGGRIEGEASVNLHDHTTSTGRLTIRDIDAAAMTSFIPELGRTSGRVDGSIAAYAAGERAVEPLRVDVELLPTDGVLRGMPWGATTATAYVGQSRIVIDTVRIAIADGSADLWANLSQREGQWYLQTQSDFNRLEYDHLRQAFEDGGQPVRARLTGTVRIGGPIEPFRDMTGQGRIEVTESDLADHAIFGSVLTQLGASAKPATPKGRGEAIIRVERGALFIDYLDYENRDVNFRASGSVADLAAGQASPVDLNIVATNKPLSGLAIPGRGEFDRIFSSFQSSFTAFRVSGTLGEPAILPAAIADFASTVKGFLRRRGEQQQPAAPQ